MDVRYGRPQHRDNDYNLSFPAKQPDSWSDHYGFGFTLPSANGWNIDDPSEFARGRLGTDSIGQRVIRISIRYLVSSEWFWDIHVSGRV